MREQVAKRILLKGGRKTRSVESIKPLRMIGRGTEGDIYEVEVIIERRGKRKILKLAEKEFRYTHYSPLAPAVGDPVAQFNLMKKLQRINRERKLGLHILPTIRLREVKGEKPRLLITLLKNTFSYSKKQGFQFELTDEELSRIPKAEKEYVNLQKSREERILKDLGFETFPDMWVLDRDPKTGKVTAWIADFGQISEKKKA